MSGLVTKEDLKRLPRRSIVAFAVRCAQRVRPLYRSDNPEHVRAVDRAISVAAAWANGDDNAAADAFAAADAAYAADFDDADADARAAYDDDAARAAHAAAAAHAAYDDDAARIAAAAAADAAARIAAARAASSYAEYASYLDFVRLQKRAERAGAKAGKGELGEPIDVGAMGPLWPVGAPNWGESKPDDPTTPKQPSPLDPSEGHALELTLDFPADFTDDQIEEALDKFVDRADKFHRALGGHGLEVSDIKIYKPTSDPVEVR